MGDSQVATESGLTIALHDLGGVGRTALLVHAASFTATMFAPLATALSAHFRSIAPDLPGHGGSTRPRDGDFSWSRLADELAAVVDALDGPIHGFGHSFGGTLLLAAAARRKGRFAAIACYEPVLLSGERAHHLAEEQALRAERRYEHFASRDDVIERLRSRPPLDRLDGAALAAYPRDGFTAQVDGTVRLVLSPSDEAAIYRASATAAFDEELEGLEVPVTLLIGSKSQGALGIGTERLSSILPRVSVEMLEGAGHLAPLEQPGEVAACLERAFGTSAA